MKIGDIVKSKNLLVEVLACGSGTYVSAIVASINPFILISQEGDMRWDELDENNFEVIGQAGSKVLTKVANRMITDTNALLNTNHLKTTTKCLESVEQDLCPFNRTGEYVFFKNIMGNENWVRIKKISFATQNVYDMIGQVASINYLIHHGRHKIMVDKKTYRQMEKDIIGEKQ